MYGKRERFKKALDFQLQYFNSVKSYMDTSKSRVTINTNIKLE